MAFVASEFEREGFTTPLLIGGATTSRVHTAVRIAPQLLRVPWSTCSTRRARWASPRACSRPDQGERFAAGVRGEYDAIRTEREGRTRDEHLLPWAEARARHAPIDWSGVTPPKPIVHRRAELRGVAARRAGRADRLDPVLPELGAARALPDILTSPETGAAASALFRDARTLLDRIVRERLLTAKGVVGFFPANALGEDIELYTGADRRTALAVVHTLRQQMAKSGDRANLALADFVAPRETGLADHLGMFAVTTGHGLDALVAEFEAGARRLQRDPGQVPRGPARRSVRRAAARDRCGASSGATRRTKSLGNDALIEEAYQGIRPAPGYPACPDHTEKATIFRLLEASARAGITLTENFAMVPTAAVSGYYFWHPEARYFGVGRIGRDQVEDYARRKGMDRDAVERWLRPNLGYET